MKMYFKIAVIMIVLITLFMNMFPYSIIVFAWGDNSDGGKGRPSYTLNEINENADTFGNTPFFNTISDAKIGNEKDFVSVQETAPDDQAIDLQGTWRGGSITVEDGEEYIIRLYANNNNPNGFDATAENVKIAFSIPSTSGRQIQVNGFIESSNASLSEYWDYINFNSDRNFHLEYCYGSALLHNNGVGQGGGIALGDEIVTRASAGGVLIGYDALDGRIPGGDTYMSYVTIRVKAVYDYDFTVKTMVRLTGEKEWSEVVDAEIGDQVEFQIEYNNTSTETQNDVMIRDILPGNLKYVAGTTKLYNYNHQNWATLTPDGDIVTRGVNIGSYVGSPDGTQGGNAFIRFTAEVVDGNLEEGINTIENFVWVGVNDTTIEDSIKIIIQNNRSFNIIFTIHIVLIVICLTIIIILICRIIKRNKIQKP